MHPISTHSHLIVRIINYFLVTMLFGLLTASIAAGNDIDSLAAKLQRPNWTDRFGVAEKIINTPNLDTTRAINILVDAIKSEVVHPTSRQYGLGSYLTNSEMLLRQYVLNLAKLGQSAIPRLRSLTNITDGESKKWLMITLGILHDDSVHFDLKTMAQTDLSQFIRSNAIFSLSFYADSTDIPVFRQALTDTSKVIVHTDIYLENGQPNDVVVHPVRETAIGAMQKMGYQVALDAEGNPYIIDK